MSTATTLIDTLTRQGIELKAEGDKLLFRPPERVTEGVKVKLREHKAEVLALLQAYAPLAEAYRRYWSLPESEPMTAFQSVHREIDILEWQVGTDAAWHTLEAAARAWYQETGACPFCKHPGVLHLEG